MREHQSYLSVKHATTVFRLAVWGLLVLYSMIAIAADPQASPSKVGQVTNFQGVKEYWTPERMKNAKPLDSNVDGRGLNIISEQPNIGEPIVRHEGRKPSVSLQEENLSQDTRLQMKPEHNSSEAQPQIKTDAFSPVFGYFTTTRVFPDAATTAFPNSTAGKLFGTDPNTEKDFTCSASVLDYRVVLTAGHCVYDAVNEDYYINFAFVPAYNGSAPIGFQAPFGTWIFDWVMAAPAWINGGGNLPNFQDVGMLVAIDQFVGRDLRRIGELTGFLGFATNSLCIPLPVYPPGCSQHVTMLGYPANLDNALRMEANFASPLVFFALGGNNTYRYGSAIYKGGSGGPWIQDYGVAPDSTGDYGPPPGFLGNNYAVSVLSYVPNNFQLWYNGGSQFDNVQFIGLFNAACAQLVGNCTP